MNKRGQLKIQEMSFMLVAVILFFILVGLFVFSIIYSNIFKSATEIKIMRQAGKISVEKIGLLLAREERYAKRIGNGIITCITNSEQKNANKALNIAGWRHSRWCSKSQHRETKIRLWFKPLMEV